MRLTHGLPGLLEVVDLEHVVDLEVLPVDSDNRTQAERNADNAIRAARLDRVEAELRDALGGLDRIEAAGGVRLSTAGVRTTLERILEAPL